jgi:hypothetical protein
VRRCLICISHNAQLFQDEPLSENKFNLSFLCESGVSVDRMKRKLKKKRKAGFNADFENKTLHKSVK